VARCSNLWTINSRADAASLFLTCAATGGAGHSRRRIRFTNWQLTYRGCSIIWESSRRRCSATRKAVRWLSNSPSTIPAQCQRLVLGCTYAFNVATRREQLEGHLAPALVGVLGPRLFAKLGVALAAKELAQERAEWLIGLMGDQDRRLMIAAWQQTMTFDSRKRLADIGCPTLIIAGSQDRAVPMHHATMLHEAIRDSRLVVVDGAAHTLIWTHTAEFVRLVAEFLEASSPPMAPE